MSRGSTEGRPEHHLPIREKLRKLYWRLHRVLAPDIWYAQLVYEHALSSVVAPDCHWLDLGCGHRLLDPWRAAQERGLIRSAGRVVGLDPEFQALGEHGSIRRRVCGDGTILPFDDGVFDLVSANMVLEHLPKPEAVFREVERVLRSGGRFLFHTPNGTGYPTLLARAVPDPVRALAARLRERRTEKERFRTYYRANSTREIARLARTSGLLVERLLLVRSSAVFALIAPLAVAELVVLRALAWRRLAWLRPNLIAVLRKPD